MWKLCIVIARHYGKKSIESKMKFLNVAEKNDAAKTIAAHLSRGNSQRVNITNSQTPETSLTHNIALCRGKVCLRTINCTNFNTTFSVTIMQKW